MCDMSDQAKVQTKVQKGECSFNKWRNQRACRVKIQHLQIFILPDIQNYQAVWLRGFGSRPKGLGLNTDVLWGLILKYFENVAWLLKNCNFHFSWANENLSLRSQFFSPDGSFLWAWDEIEVNWQHVWSWLAGNCLVRLTKDREMSACPCGWNYKEWTRTIMRCQCYFWRHPVWGYP